MLKMRITVADVSKVLASVSKICECGSRVVFDESGSYIEDDESGGKTPIHKRNGVYVMDMRIRRRRKEAVGVVDEQDEQVFSGPGANQK